MKAKSLLIAGALSLAAMGIASAKTYDVVLTSSATVGNVELKAGEYRLKVDGAQAIFTAVESSQNFAVPVKIENVDKKFGETMVETTKSGDTENIQSIDLGGSTTKLEFGE